MKYLAFISFVMILAIFLKLQDPFPKEKIDAILKQAQFQGSILIAAKGKILFANSYGLSNVEQKIPNRVETVFRIGSITKTVTAMAILLLVEKGKVHLEDTINVYLPDYPDGNKITIKHLLTHSSGIFSLTDLPDMPEIQGRNLTLHQVIATFKDQPLVFEPGADCKYSDSGYILLGAIIEHAAQMTYEQFLKENIFEPLNMHTTYDEHADQNIPNKALGYVKGDKGTFLPAEYINMSIPHAAGALSTTVYDLYKFDQTLVKSCFLPEKSKKAMLTVQAASVSHDISYGYGLRIGQKNEGFHHTKGNVIGHFGGINGFEASYIHDLENDLTIIMLSNVEGAPLKALNQQISTLLLSSWR